MTTASIETPPDQPSSASLRRKIRALDAALVLVWAAVALLVLVSSVAEEALGASRRTRLLTRFIMPEGWAFFTRDPQEVGHRLYQELADGTLVGADVTDLRGVGLGLDRRYRVRGIEIGAITARIPKEAWQPCRQPLPQCAAASKAAPTVIRLQMYVHTLCGRALVHERRPVPWAWRRSHERVNMPSRIARVDIVCEEPGSSERLARQ